MNNSRRRDNEDGNDSFAVPQPKRMCSNGVKTVKIVDATKAMERVFENRSQWRPIDPNSPKHSLDGRMVGLTLNGLSDDDERIYGRCKSSASETSVDSLTRLPTPLDERSKSTEFFLDDTKDK